MIRIRTRFVPLLGVIATAVAMAVSSPSAFPAGPANQGAGASGAAGQASRQNGRAGDERGSRPSNALGSNDWKWWHEPALKLSDDQVKAIEAIFAKRVAEAQPWATARDKERERLQRMTNDRLADEVAYGIQVTKVEALQARLNESRTMMLYKMFRLLQPEQYKKLQALIEVRFSNQGRGRQTGNGR